ncbi:type I-C CRISPR-associated protein Cas8c/Csd1 [Schleiferilactobacillus perolens]|jgi:CRISPR-associated protein Csd1|uniref:type I-C CRISPR-associated protein Cas8c/Csd1 n=1 Tax=Schleiferilactobacillus perolens TaxID=100468 RepID=UPI002357A665|nr:type I-C CRISPR-associated protein Cas8c/Csd1 [Schleiferilactobacillus perolens]MCI2170596.1 type I-C CRISPR-associated protein Cas8c/Csd1 [Schleiferilactobacillus perolens]
MSVFQELINVYDNNAKDAGVFKSGADFALLPLAHVSVKVPIQVTLTETGNFLSAMALPKEDQLTVIPATSESATRSSNPDPMPLQDKVRYCAGDFADSLANKKEQEKAREDHQRYTTLLGGWAESTDVPQTVRVIYRYILQDSLLDDLLREFQGDDKTRKSVEKGDPYIRFRVDALPDPWSDQTMFRSWTSYYLTQQQAHGNDIGIDYLTGRAEPTTKLNEKNINPATSGAKLVSANDSGGYTYRGMFTDDDFYSIGYAQSQKITHALKWLIQRQGIQRDSRVFLFWTRGDDSALVASMKILATNDPRVAMYQHAQKKQQTDTGADVAQSFRERLLGYTAEISDGRPINVMFLDAATTGRMAVVYYDLLQSDLLKDNVMRWGDQARIVRYWRGQPTDVVPTLMQVIRGAYSVGKEGTRFATLAKRAMSRLLPAIIHARPIPEDIFAAFQRHIMRPLSYLSGGIDTGTGLGNWYTDVLRFSAVANYNRKGVDSMTLDPTSTDRSYLYGRLVAVANAAEQAAIHDAKKRGGAQSDRTTTAIRFLTNVSERPATTWNRIWLAVNRSYLDRMNGAQRYYYTKQMNEIMNLLPNQEDDTALGPLFPIGFAHQSEAMHQRAQEKAKARKDETQDTQDANE